MLAAVRLDPLPALSKLILGLARGSKLRPKLPLVAIALALSVAGAILDDS